MVSFSHQVIAVSPQLCPMSMAATLVSVGNDEGDDADRLRSACVATLCELGKLVFLSCVVTKKVTFITNYIPQCSQILFLSIQLATHLLIIF